MGKSTIDNKVPTTWSEVQKDLADLQIQANATQDVSAADLKLVEQGIAQLQKSDSNTANAGNYGRLIGTVQNLQGIADSSYHATDATNLNWASEMNDVTQLAAQMGNSNTVASPNQKMFGTEVDATTLPGDAARATGTVYAIHSDPPSYAAESNGGYTVYDQNGMLSATFTKDQKPAIELGGGQVLKLSKNGFGNSWISNTLDDYSTKERAADWMPPAASSSTPASGTDDAADTAETQTINGEPQGHGPGTAYLNMAADAVALPGDLAELQKTQQVNLLADAKPPVYVTSKPGTPATYSVYNAQDGSKRGDDLTPPFAIGMGNGSWFAASDKGIASSWTTTDPKSLDKNTKLFDLNGSGDTDTTLAPFQAQGVDNAAAPSGSVGGMFVQATPAEIANLPVDQQKMAQKAGRAYTIDTTPRTILVQQNDNTHYKLFNLDDPSQPTITSPQPLDADEKKIAILKSVNQETIALNNGKFLQLGNTLQESKTYDKVEDVPRPNPAGGLYNIKPDGSIAVADSFPTAEDAKKAAALNASKAKFKADGNIDEATAKKGSGNSYHTQLSLVAPPQNDKDSQKTYTAKISSKHKPVKPGDAKVSLKTSEGYELLSLKSGKIDLSKGAYGSINLDGGAKYVACKTGYWLITDGKAKNIASGVEVDAAEVIKALQETDNKAPEQESRDIEKKIKQNS